MSELFRLNTQAITKKDNFLTPGEQFSPMFLESIPKSNTVFEGRQYQFTTSALQQEGNKNSRF